MSERRAPGDAAVAPPADEVVVPGTAGDAQPAVPEGASRPRRRRRWHRWAASAGVVLALALAGLAVVRSPLFAADHLTVEGTQHLGEAKVLRIAGLRGGENVVTFDAAAAEQRLEADPWIASATVTKDLPDAITVTVRERVPIGAAETPGGWDVLAADGTVVVTQPSPPRLPSLPPDEATWPDALAVLAPMDPALRAEVATVSIDGGQVMVSLDGGVAVAYGPVTEADAKAQSIGAVLAWAEEERADLVAIDVRVPGAPTARLAGGVVATP